MMSSLQKYMIKKGLIKSLKVEISDEKTVIIPESPMTHETLITELIILLFQHYVCNAKYYENNIINKHLIELLNNIIDIIKENSNEK